METRFPRVLDFIDSLSGETTASSAWSAFLGFVRNYGYSCGAVTDLPGPSEQLIDKVLGLSWPSGWQERYVEQDYVRRDPAVLHLRHAILPYTWDDLLNNPNFSSLERNIVYEAGDFDLNAGFVVPLHGLRSGSAILTIAGENRDTSRQDQAEMHLASIYVHAHLRGLATPPGKKTSVNLTPRERECLCWAAAGKTDWEISEILAISEKTANAHIEQAKRKFDVATRVQAVVHAIRLGLIQP